MSDVKPQPCPACGSEGVESRYHPGKFFCGNDDCWLDCLATIEDWNRLRLAPAASDETIPVRIAVVVNGDDYWAAAGIADADDDESQNHATVLATVSGPARTTFITALAYKPQPQPAMEVTGDSQAQ